MQARIAARYVLRNRRRSTLVVLGIGGGLLVLVFLKALQDGYVEQRLEQGLGLVMGHVIATPGDAGTAALLEALDADPEVLAASPRVRFEGFLKGGTGATGVAVLGVDPSGEAEATRLPHTLVEGSFLPDTARFEPAPMAVGIALAERLELTLGARCALLVEGEDGALVAEAFQVSGIFRSGGAFSDAGLVYVQRDVADRLLAVDGDAGEIVVRLHDARRARAVTARLAADPRVAGATLRTWHETSPEMMGAMEMLRVMERVRTAVLFALVALGIANTIGMWLYERQREFGVLLAIGLRPVALLQLLFLETLILAGAGLALGAAAAGLVTSVLAHTGVDFSALGASLPGALEGTGVVYPVLRPDNLLVAGAWVVLVSLAALAPVAPRVLRLDPAELLRDLR